jgi:hypothetical protein
MNQGIDADRILDLLLSTSGSSSAIAEPVMRRLRDLVDATLPSNEAAQAKLVFADAAAVRDHRDEVHRLLQRLGAQNDAAIIELVKKTTPPSAMVNQRNIVTNNKVGGNLSISNSTDNRDDF